MVHYGLGLMELTQGGRCLCRCCTGLESWALLSAGALPGRWGRITRVRAAMLGHGAWGLEVGGLRGLPLRLLTHSLLFAVGATLSQRVTALLFKGGF